MSLHPNLPQDDDPLMAIDDIPYILDESEDATAIRALLHVLGLDAGVLKKKEGFPFQVSFPANTESRSLSGSQRATLARGVASAADDVISLLRDALIYESRCCQRKWTLHRSSH